MRQQPTDEADDGFVDKGKGKYVILEDEGHFGPTSLRPSCTQVGSGCKIFMSMKYCIDKDFVY